MLIASGESPEESMKSDIMTLSECGRDTGREDVVFVSGPESRDGE
jgi:hypothetical protein